MQLKKIIPTKEKDTVNINYKFAQKYDLFYVKQTLIKFGFKSVEININIARNLKNNEIEISDNILKSLKLPLFGRYHLKVKNNKLIIGPLIGILIGTKKDTLYRRRRILQPYVKYFNKINGIVVGFTLNDLNRKDMTVNGIAYNPVNKVWERLTLPYPSAVIRRGFINKRNRQYLFSLYGEKLYNYKGIDKWEMHQRLEQFEDINKHLPKTDLYRDLTNLQLFLRKHKNIYVKPIDGNQGYGIYNLVRKKNGVIITTRKEGKNIVRKVNNSNELEEFTSTYLNTKKYLMQETLDLSINNRVIDFRVGLDRDHKGVWRHNMFVTRVGGNESIVSNVASSGGYVDYPLKVLTNLYGLNQEKAKNIMSKLLKTAYNIANKLDLTGIKLGKIALDLCVDKHLNIYLIEVNNKAPNDTLMGPLGDKDRLFQIKLENIMYAKGLAGFKERNDSVFEIYKNDHDVTVPNKIYVRLSKNKINEIKQELLDYLQSKEESSLSVNSNAFDLTISNITTKEQMNKILSYIRGKVAGLNHSILLEEQKDKDEKSHKKIISDLKKEITSLKEQNKELLRKENYYKNSKSWRITAPLRALFKILKSN